MKTDGNAMLRVVEQFLSLQGESTHAGRLCYFIRLAGCNLRCSYCDTLYAHSFDCGEQIPLAEIVQRAVASKSPLVEITGGEPLATPETPALCQALLNAGLEVLIETNGSLPIAQLPRAVRKILDCKTPSSGMSCHNLYDNYPLLLPHDEVKFVICNREDYLFACDIIKKYQLQTKTRNLLFSPGWETVNLETLAGWMIEDKTPARLQLQMHKIIWGADKIGV